MTDFLLTELIELDESCKSDQSLIDSIGDSYLFKHNFAFRRIREVALLNGTHFTSEPSFMEVYQKAPLFCLEEILATNTVPYFKTSKILKALTVKYPSITISQVLGTISGFANYVAHETAHCICHQVLTLKDEKFKRSLVQDLLSESVAFCSDFFCSYYAQAEKEEETFFIDMNCYSSSRKKQTFYIKLLQFMSPEQINSFLVRSYIGVLLTPTELDDLGPVLDAVIKSMKIQTIDSRMRGELLIFFEGLYGITVGFREFCVPMSYRQKNTFSEYENLKRLHLMNSSYVLEEHHEEIEKTAQLLNQLFIRK